MSSRLVELFARRAGESESTSPQDAMRSVVSALRRRCKGAMTPDGKLRFYLSNRRIVGIRVVEQLDADAALEPIGSMYSHGFNILLTKQLTNTRMRFTLAHELCHTFFYQFVPELKFVPHETDKMEERLCNLGAAELLMPAVRLRKSANRRPVCVQTLCELAVEFSVSPSAMFLRLRSLRLWNCILSEWQRILNGQFVLANLYGGKRLPWEWDDPSILGEAWRSFKPAIGSAFVHYQDEEGRLYYFPARFQAQRLGDRVFSLWGREVTNPVCTAPFFGEDLLPT